MHGAPFPIPANEFFRDVSHHDHRELEGKPVRFEPQEQVDAQDDREGPESERVHVAPRPGDQALDGVREHQLRDDQRSVRVHEVDVPAPVQQNRRLGTCLNPVLGTGREPDRERPAAAPGRDPEAYRPHQ